jgi:hypothetical protein
MIDGVPEEPTTRSVKIGADERTGWSSERPRKEGDAPPRPVDVSTRCRVLAPTDRMRYSPGSLLIVIGPASAEPDRFADRVIEERGVVLSFPKVRALIEGRVPAEEADDRAADLLTSAVRKRLDGGQSVVLPLHGFDALEREHYVRLAHPLRRPRHIILLDAPRDQVTDEERPALDELRVALNAGELGLEGFQTAMRLGGTALTELKRIVFAPAPRED